MLTHNRDEAPTRSPQAISREEVSGIPLLFPKDTKAGGTWIVAAADGRIACLLNGAFIKHRHQPPYRRSRGLLLLDFFSWTDPGQFFREYDLEGIEPFTFLFFQPGQVTEFRWDGTQRHRRDLPPEKSHFWCSSTLYPREMQERREAVFREWLAKVDPEVEGLPQAALHLHRTGSVGDPENDYIMNRGGRVCTVSITQLLLDPESIRMSYSDLLSEQTDQKQLARIPSHHKS